MANMNISSLVGHSNSFIVEEVEVIDPYVIVPEDRCKCIHCTIPNIDIIILHVITVRHTMFSPGNVHILAESWVREGLQDLKSPKDLDGIGGEG